MSERYLFGPDFLKRLIDAGIVDQAVQQVVIEAPNDEYVIMYTSQALQPRILDEFLKLAGHRKVIVAPRPATDPSAEIAHLRELLRARHASNGHDPSCSYVLSGFTGQCDCGWTDLKAAIKLELDGARGAGS